MSERALRRWTVEEFFAWQEHQEERYELVDGFPVQMMSGAQTVHNDVAINVIANLHSQLRGKPCRPFNADSSIETSPGHIRRPDAGVDCGQPKASSLKTDLPRLVVEVMSPSTSEIDLMIKLEEYKRVESVLYILYIHPGEPDAALWSREPDGIWNLTRATALDKTLDLPAIGISLAMSDIYERVIFPPRIAS